VSSVVLSRMDTPGRKIERFDQVRLLTVRNVSYLSASPGSKVLPQGVWSVTAIVGDNDLLLAKDNAIIRIPAVDVLVVSDYDLRSLTDILGRLSDG